MIITISGDLGTSDTLTVEWWGGQYLETMIPRSAEVMVSPDDDRADTYLVTGDRFPAALRTPILVACREVYREAVRTRRLDVVERREVVP